MLFSVLKHVLDGSSSYFSIYLQLYQIYNYSHRLFSSAFLARKSGRNDVFSKHNQEIFFQNQFPNKNCTNHIYTKT